MTIHISELIPERTRIDFSAENDGSLVFELRSRDEITPTDHARINAYRNEIAKIADQIAKTENADEIARANERLHEIFGDILRLIFVEIDESVLKSLGTGTRQKIVQYWINELRASPNPNGRANQN